MDLVLDTFTYLGAAHRRDVAGTEQVRVPSITATFRALDRDRRELTEEPVAMSWHASVAWTDPLGCLVASSMGVLLRPSMLAVGDERSLDHGLHAALHGEYRGAVLREVVGALDGADRWTADRQAPWDLRRMRCLLDPLSAQQIFMDAECAGLAAAAACNDVEFDGWMGLAHWCQRRMRGY